jgi:hypothetical protein
VISAVFGVNGKFSVFLNNQSQLKFRRLLENRHDLPGNQILRFFVFMLDFTVLPNFSRKRNKYAISQFLKDFFGDNRKHDVQKRDMRVNFWRDFCWKIKRHTKLVI